MLSNVLTAAAAIASILGFIGAAKGATKTQAMLRAGNERDIFIDVMAWADRHILRGRQPVSKAAASQV